MILGEKQIPFLLRMVLMTYMSFIYSKEQFWAPTVHSNIRGEMLKIPVCKEFTSRGGDQLETLYRLSSQTEVGHSAARAE